MTGDSGYAGVPRADQHNTILIDGRGQAAEGAGHNAFSGYPAARLDKIRLTVRALDARRFELACETAGAYAEPLRVTSVHRAVRLTGAHSIRVSDSVQAVSPVRPSFLWHADEPSILNGALRISTKPRLSSRVEPNWLTAAGRPGSVDKGPRESRGVRLVLEPPAASASTQVVTTLRF